jgi:hypothetical protein
MPRSTLESNGWLAVIVMHYGTTTAWATTNTLLALTRITIVVVLVAIIAVVAVI